MKVLVLEGGTSTSRATLVSEGRVLSRSAKPGGAGDRDRGGFLAALAASAREAVAKAGVEPEHVVACGMLGSEWGLVELPHVPVPAGVNELAAGARDMEVPELIQGTVTVIPGVRTDEDACRGEETAAMALPGRRLVFPGSHTKLVERDERGRIVSIATTAAGELVRAIVDCTLPGADAGSVETRPLDPGSLSEGCRAGGTRGLGFAVFQLRARRLIGRPLADPLAYLIGAVAADDARMLGAEPFAVAVDSPWASLWAEALRVAGDPHAVEILDAENAAVDGALAVLAAKEG